MADNTSATSGSPNARDQGGAKRSNLNSAIAQRQKLLLGGIGAVALIAGSMSIFGGDDATLRLIEAMANDAVLPGFRSRAALSRPRRTGSLEVQQVAEYEGAELTGQAFSLRNLGSETIDLANERAAPAGALAFAYGRDALAPGETTQAFLVFAKGGLE